MAGHRRQLRRRPAPDRVRLHARAAADPARIAIRLSGARSLRIDRTGDLLARLPGGALARELAPHAYQRTDAGRRIAVPSRYALGAHGVVQIALGRYDRTRRLVIDPSVALDYSTYLGGSGGDAGAGDGTAGIAVDSTGAAFVTGAAGSTDFPTKNAFQPKNNAAAAGLDNGFVAKLAPFGARQGGGGPERVSAHLQLGSVRLAPARRGCKAERAHASSLHDSDCTRAVLRLAGTIDKRADGQALIIVLRAKLGHRRVLILAHARVHDGRWGLRVGLPARDREPGDRWRFTVAYSGDRRLRAASVTGGFVLEAEVANRAPI